MKQIRLGLDFNLDVSKYAIACYDENKMEVIREELKKEKMKNLFEEIR